MAGLVRPSTSFVSKRKQDVDAGHKAGHEDREAVESGSADARIDRLEERGDFARRPRRAEQIALHLRAAFGAEDAGLLVGPPAFRNRDHTEIFAEARHRADDGDAVVLASELLDEGAVDLDLVEGEAAQIAQRR